MAVWIVGAVRSVKPRLCKSRQGNEPPAEREEVTHGSKENGQRKSGGACAAR